MITTNRENQTCNSGLAPEIEPLVHNIAQPVHVSVAVGDGALATLTAYKYLVENKLATKARIDDEWP